MATSVKASTSAKDTNRRRTITVRLPDELWQQLDEYCEKLLAKPHMMVAGLVSSYLQTMKKNGDLILPEFPSTSYKYWTPVPGTKGFVIEQLSPEPRHVDQNPRRSNKYFKVGSQCHLRLIQCQSAAEEQEIP